MTKTQPCAKCHKPDSVYCVFDLCEQCFEDKIRCEEFLDELRFKRQGVWKPMITGGGWQKATH